MFLFICITLKSVTTLKLILSLCIAEEGQTETVRECKNCQAKGAAALLKVKGKTKRMRQNERKEESRDGEFAVITNYKQIIGLLLGYQLKDSDRYVSTR